MQFSIRSRRGYREYGSSNVALHVHNERPVHLTLSKRRSVVLKKVENLCLKLWLSPVLPLALVARSRMDLQNVEPVSG